MITQQSIQAVLNRADLREVVGQFITLKKRGSNYIANCPFHNEKTPSFSISPAKGFFKCFGCGKGGNVVTFIQEHEKYNFPEAIRWLADFYKIELEETEHSEEQKALIKTEESLRIINEFAAKWFSDFLLNHDEGKTIGLSYFKERGIHLASIEKFRLGYCPDAGSAFATAALSRGYDAQLLLKTGLIKERNGDYYDAYRGRIIFPIQSVTGKVVGFGARLLKNNDKAPKYINTPENEVYHKSQVLYGLNQSRSAIIKKDECLLTEGYTDLIALHQSGFENVVSSSGTSLTEDQLRLIARQTKNLTILYDGDPAGIKAALRGLDMALSESINVRLVLLPEGHDPDSFIKENGAQVFQDFVAANKKDVITFKIETGLAEGLGDPMAKTKLVNEVAQTIAKVNKLEDFVLQEHFILKASQLLEVDQGGLVSLVNKYIREELEQKSRSQRFQQEDMPAAPDPTVVSNASIRDAQNFEEQQEWQLIRMLIAVGDYQVEGYENVADLVQEMIDPDLIENKDVRHLFDVYYDYLHDNQTLPSLNFFSTHPDEHIQKLVPQLVSNHPEISENWKAKYNIETRNSADVNLQEANSTILYFELKKVKHMQSVVLNHLRTESRLELLNHWQQQYVDFKKREQDILHNIGTVIIKVP